LGVGNQAAATFGGSVYIAHGMVALSFSILFNNTNSLALDPFLRLWAGTLLSLVFGFLLLAAALLVGSDIDFRRIIGGAMGTLCALIGAINALALLTTSVGVTSTGVAGPQVGVAGEVLFLTTLAVLLAGFPLGMIGSLQVLHERGTGGESQA
jgi:hypothetical protein